MQNDRSEARYEKKKRGKHSETDKNASNLAADDDLTTAEVDEGRPEMSVRRQQMCA